MNNAMNICRNVVYLFGDKLVCLTQLFFYCASDLFSF